MTFTVEDGTGLEDANSYASYADWTAYWADRGTAPAGSQTAVEQALVRGADYLGRRYCWIGQKATAEQALDWPRLCALDEPAGGYSAPIEGVPPEVVTANIELAQRALAGELAPDHTVDATGQTVTSKRDKVGPIETERQFSGASSGTWVKKFPSIDQLLRRLVVKTGGRVFRA